MNTLFDHKIFLSFFIFFLACSFSFAAPKIEYTLSMSNPHTHYFEVEMKISDINQKNIDLKMPTWAPGSYLIREFSKSIDQIQVNATNGNVLPIEKITKNTWRITTKGVSDIIIKYEVYAFEMSVRTSFLDATHGYVNGSSIFLYPDKLKNLSSTLTVIPYKEWNVVSTSLPEVSGKKWVYQAADYDRLADSPIEIGNHEIFEFSAAGLQHKVAMYGEGNYDQAALKEDLAKVVESCTRVFGDNPTQNYLFIIHNLTKGSGGLEHLNSTTLQVSRWAYQPRSSYLGFLSLATHEYFHLWNVKRIRPLELGPFDYDNENYNRLLWVMEGFTSYYDELLLAESKLADDKYFVNKVAGAINNIENQPGNKVQPVSEASFDAWIKSYRPNENSANTTISYYTKGSVLAALLDLEIIQSTNGSKNLDDVMKFLYNEYYKKKNRGFTSPEFQAAVEGVAGKKLDEFFKNYVYDTKPIDYNKYFNYAGLKLTNFYEGSEIVSLGIGTEEKSGKIIVKSVMRGTSAYDGGVNVNDEIISIDGFRLEQGELSKVIGMKSPGDSVSVIIARDGIIETLQFPLKPDPSVSYRFTNTDSVTDQQRKVYNKWVRQRSE